MGLKKPKVFLNKFNQGGTPMAKIVSNTKINVKGIVISIGIDVNKTSWGVKYLLRVDSLPKYKHRLFTVVCQY